MKKVIISALATALMAGTVCAQEVSLTPVQQGALGIQVETAMQINQVPSAWYSGEAMFALNTVREVTASVSGQIVALDRVHGEVTKGERIAIIESAQIAQMQGALLSDLASLDSAQKELKRAQQLSRSGASSAKALQQAQVDVSRLGAQLQQAKQSLLLAGFSAESLQKLEQSRQMQSSQVVLSAPADGELYEMHVTKGQQIDAYQSLYQFGELNPITVHVMVPIDLAAQLEEGQAVEIKLGSAVLSAQVSHIERHVDAMTQSQDIHIHVANPDNKLLPGQRLQVRFLQGAAQAYRVSLRSLAQLEGQSVVFTRQAEALKAVPIEVLAMRSQSLYFAPVGQATDFSQVVSVGTSAIKLAMSADEEE